MIEIINLRKKFGNVSVLEGINLEINQSGIIAVLGPNGSGKTTLIKCILGMVLPDEGSIAYQKKSVLGKWNYRNNIAYLPQIAQFPDNLTVREVISMIKNLRNQPTHEEELIELFKLNKYLTKKLRNLSGGTRQKVNIVLTFMFDSPILILDEPTAGLDPVSLLKLKKLVQREKGKGKTILITTHIINLVEEIADEIVFLLEGNIYFKGNIEQLQKLTEQENLEHSIAKILEGEND